MTLSERYKFHSRKSIRPYMKLIILLVFSLAIFQTFARYSSVSVTPQSFQIAKWVINVNNEQLTNETESLSQPIQLLNASDGTNRIDLGDDCYFDITIDPEETEVSIDYTISVDLSSQDATLPEGTIILKYEEYVGGSAVATTTNVNDTELEISNTILLSNNQALSTNDSRKYRIFCRLPSTANVTKDFEYNIVPRIIIEQNI